MIYIQTVLWLYWLILCRYVFLTFLSRYYFLQKMHCDLVISDIFFSLDCCLSTHDYIHTTWKWHSNTPSESFSVWTHSRRKRNDKVLSMVYLFIISWCFQESLIQQLVLFTDNELYIYCNLDQAMAKEIREYLCYKNIKQPPRNLTPRHIQERNIRPTIFRSHVSTFRFLYGL